jgi:hypothetical protein
VEMWPPDRPLLRQDEVERMLRKDRPIVVKVKVSFEKIKGFFKRRKNV